MIIDPAIRHQRQRLLNCEQRTFHIRIECLIEVFFGNFADWSEAAAAGVRIDDIEPPFFALDLCEELVEIIKVRGVGFNGCQVAAHKVRSLVQLGLSPTGNEDVRSLLDETLGGGKADSGGAACDKRDLSAKFS
jgi:hypothetical protein